MRSAPKTGVVKACLRPVVEKDTFIFLRKAEATTVVIMGVSVAQQPIRVVQNTLGTVPI